jgi:DNA-binding MarR family transcriptional regulator
VSDELVTGKVTAPAPSRGRQDRLDLSAESLRMLVMLRELMAGQRRLRGDTLRVLLYIAPELLDRRHRVVKQIVLARTLGMRQQVAGWHLRRLVDMGLLEHGPNEGSLKTYRLTAALLLRFRYPHGMSAAS